MLDVLFILITTAFFCLCAAYTHGLERLGR